MNREFDFGAPDRIDWRGDFGEGDNPLRRMTLSYMGAAVAALAAGKLEPVAAMLAALERDNAWNVPGVMRDVWNPYAASHRVRPTARFNLTIHSRLNWPLYSKHWIRNKPN